MICAGLWWCISRYYFSLTHSVSVLVEKVKFVAFLVEAEFCLNLEDKALLYVFDEPVPFVRDSEQVHDVSVFAEVAQQIRVFVFPS